MFIAPTQPTSHYCSRKAMTPFHFILFLLPFLPLTLSTVSFPLTAIPHYSELSPCAVSHLSQNWNDPWYKGCSSETPISAYGSCLCVLRLSTLQNQISRDFQNDDDCSSNGVQAYLTAFCGQRFAGSGAWILGRRRRWNRVVRRRWGMVVQLRRGKVCCLFLFVLKSGRADGLFCFPQCSNTW